MQLSIKMILEQVKEMNRVTQENGTEPTLGIKSLEILVRELEQEGQQ